MIIRCQTCSKYFDDEFRNTHCPHNTFAANNGQNWFTHYPKSYLNDHPPADKEMAEYKDYLENNKVKIKVQI